MRLRLTAFITATVVFTLFASGLPVGPVPAGPLSINADELPYDMLAQNFRERYGIENVPREETDFHKVLTDNFMHTQVGIFHLYMSRYELDTKNAAEGKSSADSFKGIAAALLQAQEKWLDWLAPAGLDQAQVRKDLKTMAGWVKSWRNSVLVKESKEGAQELLDALKAKQKVHEASSRLAVYMGSLAAFGKQRDEPVYEPIVLVPNRKEFVEYMSFAGWIDPELRPIFWKPEVIVWTEFYLLKTKILALEYAAHGTAEGDYEAGVSMNEVAPSGMQQQIVQLATNAMLDNFFGSSVPPAFAGGLSLNLVVEVFGEARTRVDGDLRERRTQAIEIFVPGGNSAGGVLPTNSAGSRWREDNGSHFFARILKGSQKDGAQMSKKARDKISHFRLLDDDKVKNTVIHGPFLGTPAMDFELPAKAFQGDYVEFLRSYRCGFVNWLHIRALKKKKDAEAKFAELLIELSKSEDSAAFEKTFDRVYELPLSHEELDGNSLEGGFLTWLSKQ